MTGAPGLVFSLDYQANDVFLSLISGIVPQESAIPRVVPGQITDAIDYMFGPNHTELDSRRITHAHRAETQALLGLLDELPKELIDLGPADYLELSRCRAVLARLRC